jgi:hypothetical protein
MRGPASWILVLVAGGFFLAPAPGRAQMPAPAVSSPRPLHLGGYGSLALGYSRVAGDADSFDLTEAAAALLFSGTAWSRLSYFGELDLASRGSENWTGRQDDRKLEVERLYAEYSFSDAFRLRAGRFLTPIGQWNENHAEPLTWTTLRPLTTYRPFAKSSTGVMVAGETVVGGRGLGYAAYLAPPALAKTPSEENAFLNAAGFRVALEVVPGTYLGVSSAAFKGSRPAEVEGPGEGTGGEDGGKAEDGPGEGREEDENERALVGLDFLTRIHGVEVSGEAVWLSESALEPVQRGAFVQGVVPLVGTLFGVLRAEGYEPVDEDPLWIYSVGATWRFHPRLVFKVERQITHRSSFKVPDGWFLSISSLF